MNTTKKTHNEASKSINKMACVQINIEIINVNNALWYVITECPPIKIVQLVPCSS